MAAPGADVRAVTEDELPTFVRAGAAGFGESAEELAKHQPRWNALELDRTRAAFDGDDIVGTSRNYSLELTLPGGAVVPAAGVSAVAVLPTHRRRGILRAMMAALLDDAAARGEPVAMLTASEGAIYQRFGFGVSTRSMSFEIDVRTTDWAQPPPAGRVRLVTPEEARKHAPELFDRVRRAYPGAVSRPEAWWTDVQYYPDHGNRFDVLYESPAGVVDGFVAYGIKDVWSWGSKHVLRVPDLVAATPDALHALWRYLCEIDLVKTVKCDRLPLDSPLAWLFTSPRVPRVDGVFDYVWTRVLDVPVALAARTYAVADTLTIEVHDPSRPDGPAVGTFTIDGGPDGASVKAAGTPDLVVDVSTLSTAWLGGIPWSTLAAAGWVEERGAGAVARADAMFASTPLPFPFTWF
ncbi:MAG TPA: GNAT family N-acetyltransferase [Acidimicrobiia bacterium]|jgi:predicted acetyltransferase